MCVEKCWEQWAGDRGDCARKSLQVAKSTWKKGRSWSLWLTTLSRRVSCAQFQPAVERQVWRRLVVGGTRLIMTNQSFWYAYLSKKGHIMGMTLWEWQWVDNLEIPKLISNKSQKNLIPFGSRSLAQLAHLLQGCDSGLTKTARVMPLPWQCLISSCPRLSSQASWQLLNMRITKGSVPLTRRYSSPDDHEVKSFSSSSSLSPSSSHHQHTCQYTTIDLNYTHFCWWRSPWQSYDNTFMQSNLILPKPMATLPILTHASCHHILPTSIIPFPQPRQTPCSKRQQTNDIILQLMLQSHGGFQFPSSIPVATSSYLASTPQVPRPAFACFAGNINIFFKISYNISTNQIMLFCLNLIESWRVFCLRQHHSGGWRFSLFESQKLRKRSRDHRGAKLQRVVNLWSA